MMVPSLTGRRQGLERLQVASTQAGKCTSVLGNNAMAQSQGGAGAWAQATW